MFTLDFFTTNKKKKKKKRRQERMQLKPRKEFEPSSLLTKPVMLLTIVFAKFIYPSFCFFLLQILGKRI